MIFLFKTFVLNRINLQFFGILFCLLLIIGFYMIICEIFKSKRGSCKLFYLCYLYKLDRKYDEYFQVIRKKVMN